MFTAIDHATRREIIRRLAHAGPATISALASQFPSSRQAVTKHIRILDESGLISITRAGREKRCELNASALKQVYEWVTLYQDLWDEKLDSLGTYLAQTDRTE